MNIKWAVFPIAFKYISNLGFLIFSEEAFRNKNR
jgi:hypothetical protein